MSASSVFTCSADYERPTGHPAELPEGIAERLYKPFDTEALVTLDPFMGTGKLLDPARLRGRRVVGIEAEPGYCEIAVKRLQQEVLPL